MFFMPEHGLLLAILESAVVDAALEEGSNIDILGEFITRSVRTEAHEWLFDWKSSDSAIEFSFPWVCWHLDIDPALVSAKLEILLQECPPSKIKTRFESFYKFLRTDSNPYPTAA